MGRCSFRYRSAICRGLSEPLSLHEHFDTLLKPENFFSQHHATNAAWCFFVCTIDLYSFEGVLFPFCHYHAIKVFCFGFERLPRLPNDTLRQTFVISNLRNISSFVEFNSDYNTSMFSDVSGRRHSFPSSPI